MSFNLNLFTTPAIALILVLWGYFYFKKKVGGHPFYHKYLTLIGSQAFFLNWGWEVAQGPLYQDFDYNPVSISFCALASVADMLMVYVLLFGFGLIYKDVYWLQKLTGARIFLLVLVGGTGAILAEIRHTSSGNWYYADAMPLLPMVGVGLSPVLQFTLLPVLIFWLTGKLLPKTKPKNS
ncbi:MAG: hypothetical protein U5L96_06925 [Owenweeksia sp.]|nr:hypothetical protein [Owenweeksia sp.]